MISNNQKGFSIIEIVLVVVVIGIIGTLGYVFLNRQQAATTAATAPVVVPTAPTITKTSDLDTANSTLDQLDVDKANADDTTQLDKDLASF